jgi:NADH dehydrogenase
MSAASSKKAEKFLQKLGVEILLSTQVVDYNGRLVSFKSGESIRTKTLVWAAGITANLLEGVPTSSVVRGRRLLCDSVNRLQNANDIFVLGDTAYITNEKWPNGHPQVAQVAIQQARNLARNFVRLKKGQPLKPFRYSDYGSMATVGRNKAVVDLPFAHFQGLFAWILWMFIHLRSIFGLKNKIQIFINWVWSYLTYDQSLRLTFLPKDFRFRTKA